MKQQKILFWTSTIIIFLFEGVMPALTSHTELAKEGIRHLGYPAYFGPTLMIFKVLGTLAILIPAVPSRLKEWAYAGLAFDFLFAAISHCVVDGINFLSLFPLIILGILIISYISRNKLAKLHAVN